MHGMVASEHPLATQTGVDVLRRGGNAFDAALAVSAVLPVVKPGRTHLGGDAYVLVYTKGEGRVTAVCSGGKAPAGATPERYSGGIPQRGGAATSVPGLVDAWSEIAARWCSRPLAELLRPAIAYARDGFAVSRELELVLNGAQRGFGASPALGNLLSVAGNTPRMGEVLRQPAVAEVLERVASEGRAGFYEGAFADRLAAGVREAGGYLSADDLAGHEAQVLDPLSVDYRGYTVYETPPNSQGLILLEELSILEGYDLAAWGQGSADATHHMVEAKKIAFEDRQRFAGDPAFTNFDPKQLITKEHAAARRRDIDPRRARSVEAIATSSDTTSFVVADGAGNMCSFIQSLYAPFGSYVCVDGVIFNNRMTGFSLEPGRPNALAPGKRTMHTLNAYMVFRSGRPYMIGGTPGGDYQVQTNLQVIANVLDFGLDPQAAVDAPRWGHNAGKLELDQRISASVADDLRTRGHDVVEMPPGSNARGPAQVIVIDQGSGALLGGSPTRAEGAAAGW
jgi:gamma-glutamyltranspeptidase/glutathione hydrolase